MRIFIVLLIGFFLYGAPVHAAFDVEGFFSNLWTDVEEMGNGEESISNENRASVETRTEASASSGNNASVKVEQNISGGQGTMHVERSVTTVVNGVETSSTEIKDVPAGAEDSYSYASSTGGSSVFVESKTIVNSDGGTITPKVAEVEKEIAIKILDSERQPVWKGIWSWFKSWF